jgi:hypothetical protein
MMMESELQSENAELRDVIDGNGNGEEEEEEAAATTTTALSNMEMKPESHSPSLSAQNNAILLTTLRPEVFALSLISVLSPTFCQDLLMEIRSARMELEARHRHTEMLLKECDARVSGHFSPRHPGCDSPLANRVLFSLTPADLAHSSNKQQQKKRARTRSDEDEEYPIHHPSTFHHPHHPQPFISLAPSYPPFLPITSLGPFAFSTAGDMMLAADNSFPSVARASQAMTSLAASRRRACSLDCEPQFPS